MARREKKIEKKRQKRDQKQRAAARVASLGIIEEMRRASREPVLDCAISGANGMYQLIFTRRLPTGRIAFTLYLVDQYCLGVKNAMVAVLTPAKREELLGRVFKGQRGTALDPASARRYVEDAIAYARRYGFEPHRDALKALPLFGDIDPAAATKSFEFGKDGKPFYISGPHDSEAVQQRVIKTLALAVGEGNFHFVMPVSPDSEWFPADEASPEDWEEVGEDDMDGDDLDADDEPPRA